MASAKELREKTDQELLDQLALEKKNIFDATVRGASGETIKPHEQRIGKKTIAQIQTLLSERKLRVSLAERSTSLEAKAGDAQSQYVRMSSAAPRPTLGRQRVRAKDLSLADRAAIKLTEVKRLQVCLERDDPGQSK